MVNIQLQTPSDIARVIKNARAHQNLTQQEVADAVGITRQSLARLERGNGGTSFDTVLLILDHLGIRLDATTERRSTTPAAVTTTSTAQSAADALAKRITPLIDSSAIETLNTERLPIPGSVLLDPPRAVEGGPQATADAEAHPDPDGAGNAE